MSDCDRIALAPYYVDPLGGLWGVGFNTFPSARIDVLRADRTRRGDLSDLLLLLSSVAATVLFLVRSQTNVHSGGDSSGLEADHRSSCSAPIYRKPHYGMEGGLVGSHGFILH